MRFRRKVDGKFVDFSKNELIQQIKDAVLPECSVEDLCSLLDTILEVEVTDAVDTEKSQDADESIQIGSLGWWQNPLDEVRLGVLVSDNVLQLYEKTRYGYQPRPERVDRNGWNLIERVEDYCYVERPSGIYLVY